MPTPFPDVGEALRRQLAHPLVRNIDRDDPAMPAAHRQMIERKPLLRDVYDEWYAALAAHLIAAHPVLEIGSGAGYLDHYVPGLLTSDVRPTPSAKIVLDAHRLPFGRAALGAIAMTNVVHHLPDVTAFFADAGRTVKPGGLLAAIEPWVTPWSSWIYRRLHHEAFDPGAPTWEFSARGPLSSANGALPWILFVRDPRALRARVPAVASRARAARVAGPLSPLGRRVAPFVGAAKRPGPAAMAGSPSGAARRSLGNVLVDHPAPPS